jgi:hypothetical protein
MSNGHTMELKLCTAIATTDGDLEMQVEPPSSGPKMCT